MTHPQRDTSRWGKFRDVMAWRLANWVLNSIATEWYRKMILGSILYGLDAAERDAAGESDLNR